MNKISLITVFLLLWGCNNAYIDDVDRGAGYNYQRSFPELRISATGFVDTDNSTQIVISGDIVYGSLVYANTNGDFEASFTIDLVISEDTKDQHKVEETTFSQKVSSKDENIINSQEVHRFEKVFEIPPGKYNIQAIITDHRSGKRTERTSTTTIPNPDDESNHITEIRILAKDIDDGISEFNPITTYDIPSRYDTLQFVFQVTNNNPDVPLKINSRLLKFRSDNSVPRPMSANTPAPSTLPYKGIDYDRSEEIQSSQRTLQQPGSVVIEFKFADLERGNYRLLVSSEIDEENKIYKGRDFGIKSENYPSLETARELARPLYYVMNEDEYEDLMSIEDSNELKSAIDRFWLSNIKNSAKARQVISLYYRRVEEANKQFSNYKEGWKTDLGMVYILFGPPWYTNVRLRTLFWSYAHDRSDPTHNYYFVQPSLKNDYYPFDNYILQRSSAYFTIEYQQRGRWRNGLILNQY